VFVVHALLSSHCEEEVQQLLIGVRVHWLFVHASIVHGFPSLHCVDSVQQPEMTGCEHVPIEEQTSFVHALLSVAHASPVAAG
jgi:hypothetical protein